MCRLASYDTVPPGGYLYTQTEGIKREFPSLPTIESQAQAVSAFRAGNGLPRSSVRECLTDIDHFNAARLGCHRRWCVSVDPATGATTTALSQTSPIITPCKGCGAQLLTV